MTALTSCTARRRSEIARIVGGREAVRVAGDAAEPDHDAGVLDAPVGIEQLRADAAGLRAHRQRDHFGEPFAVRHLDVVVDEAEDRAGRLARRRIVQAREIERLGPRQDADRRVGAQFGEQSLGVAPAPSRCRR